MTLPDDFVFSQSSLQDFVDCAQRFKLRYIEKMRYPSLEANPPLKFEEHMRQGDRFHTMVQQHLAGVPASALAKSVANDATLSEWWDTFTQHGLKGLPAQRHVETTLQTSLAGYRLIAKYDLIAVEPDGQVTIIDWKTSRNVTHKDTLERRLQTKVYPYVLAQAGAYLYGGNLIPPERIKMVYWFVANEGQTVEFEYSSEQMQSDEKYLSGLISEIESANKFWLTEDTHKCRYCSYRSLCNRGDKAGDWNDFDADEISDEPDSFDVDFDQIAEIEF